MKQQQAKSPKGQWNFFPRDLLNLPVNWTNFQLSFLLNHFRAAAKKKKKVIDEAAVPGVSADDEADVEMAEPNAEAEAPEPESKEKKPKVKSNTPKKPKPNK